MNSKRINPFQTARAEIKKNTMNALFSRIRFLAEKAGELIAVTFTQWWNDDPFRLASSLAFYTIFSMAPILLISVGVASIVFSEEEAKRQVIRQIEIMTGSEGAIVARQVMENLSEIGENIRAVVIGIVTVLIGSTAVFVNLQSALNHIWKVKSDPRGSLIKGLIRDRMRSFGIVLAVGFLLLVSMAFSALLSGIQEMAAQRMASLSWIWKFSSTAVSFVVTILLYAMIFKYLPDVKIRWSDVLTGATITAVLFSIGKYLIGLYLAQTAFGSTYGAAGSFVILLIWIYYSALISFLGAEFTQSYARLYGRRITPEPHAVRVESAR
ncbi:MAG: YihY/virulence factor BrkB family protein [Syntrophales bacterium]|nr:YihY/virulence factor BrkB family protein [Syntrophales bacterium]MDY0043657.1 YihY/virulence factor BrkB family protein [Syntrophales bacterium]